MNNKLCLPNGVCCRPGVYRWCQMCRAYRVAKSTFAHDILYVACSSVDLSKLLTMGVDKGSSPSLIHCSGGASAVKEPGHFEVRKSSSQVTRMHFFLEKSWRPVRYGNIFYFLSTLLPKQSNTQGQAGRSQGLSQGLIQDCGTSSRVIWPGAPWCSTATDSLKSHSQVEVTTGVSLAAAVCYFFTVALIASSLFYHVFHTIVTH